MRRKLVERCRHPGAAVEAAGRFLGTGSLRHGLI
jgi:hypothetical protein